MKRQQLLLIIAVVILLLLGWWWLRPDNSTPVKTKSSSATSNQNDKQTEKPTDQPKDSFDKTQFSTSDPTSPWVIVNKQHPLQPKDYAPSDLVAVGNGQYLRAEAATALSNMLAAAKQAGLTITPDSGYRSYSTQVSVYDSEVRAYGQAVADSESARPGFSEHQTGLAMDLSGGGCHIEDCFGETREGKWAAAHAADYGFILRYTPANSADTGYRAESWHFRYVGIPLAHQIAANPALSMESFFGVSGGPNY